MRRQYDNDPLNNISVFIVTELECLFSLLKQKKNHKHKSIQYK